MVIQTKKDPLNALSWRLLVNLGIALFALLPAIQSTAQSEEGEDYRDLPIGEPQFFVDSYWIRKRTNEEGSAKAVPFTFHPPRFQPDPVLVADEPWEASGVGDFSVLYDADDAKYRLYYELENTLAGAEGYPKSPYLIAYAESEDGFKWSKPRFDRIPWGETRETNLIFGGEIEARFPHVHVRPEEGSKGARNLGELPQGSFGGARFLMTYRDGYQRFAASRDGIHFKEEGVGMLRYRTESFLTLSQDSRRKAYTTFLTAGVLHESPRPVAEGGLDRMVAALSAPELLSDWDRPIELARQSGKIGSGRVESLKAFRHGGLYWGFVERPVDDPPRREVELTTSRGGTDWGVPTTRPPLIPVGVASVWGSSVVHAADRIVEDGEDWRLYYSASGSEAGAPSEIGVASFQTERVISVRADETGMTSYLETRAMLWPGGRLWLNADASKGSVETRVKDSSGEVIPGFSFEEANPLQADGRRLEVGWKTRDISELKNEAIHIEFRFNNADLFAFLAEP